MTSHDLLLAGDGPERAALEQLARDLKLGEKVKFLGRAERPVAVSLFKGCSFFVLPSRLEPQGIVNLEAMACGKAVIASKVGGVPEIVLDGETGLLFPGEDVAALANALTRMADDAALRARMGAAGRARAETLDWKLYLRGISQRLSPDYCKAEISIDAAGKLFSPRIFDERESA